MRLAVSPWPWAEYIQEVLNNTKQLNVAALPHCWFGIPLLDPLGELKQT